MSCYLTFYGIPVKEKTDEEKDFCKEKELDIERKPISIVSFSRNDGVFRYFNDNCSIPFTYNEIMYVDIDESDIDAVVKDINNDIKENEKRLSTYEKYATSNHEYIEEIIQMKDYLEELYRVLHNVEFIGKIVTEAGYKYSGGFGKIVANMG